MTQVSGDGTPGPAREAALTPTVVSGPFRTAFGDGEKWSVHLAFENVKDAIAALKIATGEIVLASGDSGGGPREAGPFPNYGLPGGIPVEAAEDSEESLDLRDDWERLVEENAALRAELGRAGTEPSEDDIRPVFREGFEAAFYESPTEPHQPHIDRAEEIAWLHSKARTRAAAPAAERREPAP